MWFKNLAVYRLQKPFEHTPELLHELLAECEFKPCAGQELSRMGWVPPLGRQGQQLVHAAGGYIMLCARRQERVLPAASVNEALEDQVDALQKAEDRRVGRKEKSDIKKELVFSMVPKAFTRSKNVFGYIAVEAGLVIIDAASSTVAEEWLDALREALGSLQIIPLKATRDPIQVMTGWLQGVAPDNGLGLGNECELKDAQDVQSVIRGRNQDLHSDEFKAHLENGMIVTKVGLQWQDRLQCVVDEKFTLKKLSFDDIVQERAESAEVEDAAQQFDLDFSIMSLELDAFLKGLIEAFGGISEE